MTPKERERLQKLDDLVLDASAEELEKIQLVDSKNQLEGLSLYDVYLDSGSLVEQNSLLHNLLGDVNAGGILGSNLELRDKLH